MQIKITRKEEKPLLSRTEIFGEIGYDSATPSRTALRKEISTAMKSSQDLIVIRHITPIFGRRKSKITAHIYKNQEDLKMYESPVIVKRNSKASKKAEEKDEEKVEVKAEVKAEKAHKKAEEKAEE